jgi:hypothetical protein
MKYCHNCHTEWEGVTQPGIRETCDKCSADLHICLNCRFYDERKPNQCQIDNVDPVTDKERANFCEEFQFADRPLPEKNVDKTSRAKDQWRKLFK